METESSSLLDTADSGSGPLASQGAHHTPTLQLNLQTRFYLRAALFKAVGEGRVGQCCVSFTGLRPRRVPAVQRSFSQAKGIRCLHAQTVAS